MKKSFMTRVLAVSLSAAMAFSMSSASNLMTASAASTVKLNTTFKTLKVNQTYKLSLKSNTLNWKITKVTTTNKAICTVYGKTSSYVMLKGKGVGRATISVKAKTTRRKYPNNIKIMKCRANVTAAAPSETAFSASAVANSNTEVRVTFSQEIDAPEAANFTVSDSVTVSKAELSEDRKSVVLTIAGAEYGKNYDLTVSGIKVGGKEQAEQKLTFTTPAATEKYPMTLEAKDPILKSDGQSQTVVTFTIKDENGNPITDKGVEVAFTTSLGKFAEQRVSIQNGVATVMYTSEALMETQTAAITATVVESQNNQELMGLTTSSSITLTPNPEALNDTSIGAIITSATAPTADRVVAYFNQKVEAKDFKTASGKIDRSKFECTIKSGLDNGFADVTGTQTHNVVGILDVPGDENALQLLVETPMTDNTNVKVDFENKTQSSSLVTAKNTVYFKLTDAHQPSVLTAKGEGLRTVTIEFSEAVLPTKYCDDIEAIEKFAADNINNYLIDGRPLNDWKVAQTDPDKEEPDATDGSIKKISSKNDAKNELNASNNGSIKIGTYKDGTDSRHVVTITLGGDNYLTPGTHSLSISNVGDWAAKTDRERNIVNTQSFDFTVEANDVIPTFEVEEQSPEQYMLKFNSDIIPVDQTFTTPNSALDEASSLKLQQLVGSTWVDITDNSTASGKNPIRVSQVDDTRNYIVEVTRDWTQVYNTSSTRTNYFNYDLRLHVDANKLRNPANNKLNAEINIPLNGTIMKSPDVVSPVIGEVVPAEDTSGNLTDSYNVTLSEPVKLSDGTNGAAGANGEGLTPSQTQAANSNTTNNQGVPMPSAQFIRVDNGQTVEGIITSNVFIDATDTTINVAPESALSAGEWRLVLSSISDDYGNTASTVAHTINVTAETVSTNFRIVWAAVSTKDDYSYQVSNVGKGGNGRGRYIFVKFNKPITMTGNSVNAGVTGNYTINGSTLPTGTQIRANINGYDEHDGITDSITIVLPQGNVNIGTQDFTVDAQNAMLNVSRAITSTSGETLTNGGMIRLPFQYGSATTGYGDDIASLAATTDAVWGNDISERYNEGTGSITNLREYYQKLKSALEDEKYRRVILTADLDLNNIDSTGSEAQKDAVAVFGRSHTLTINRAVHVDMNGYDIKGNVVVSTTDGVDEIKISATNSGSEITGYGNNKDTVATLTVNAGNAEHFVVENVAVSAAGEGTAVNINDTYKNSFVNKGTITGTIRISDTNGAGFTNEGILTNSRLVIDSDGEVNLSGNLSYLTADPGILVSRAAKLTIGTGNGCNIKGVTIRVAAAGTRTIFTDNVEIDASSKFVAEADNVRVQLSTAVTKDNMNFVTDKGGKIVTVNDKNVEITGGNAIDQETDPEGIQAVLNKLNALDGEVKNEDQSATITTSAAIAITGSGLNINNNNDYANSLESKIKENVKTALGERGNNVTVSVSYTLLSNNVLERSNGYIRVKNNASDTDKDTIRVVISCDGYSVTKQIEVSK